MATGLQQLRDKKSPDQRAEGSPKVGLRKVATNAVTTGRDSPACANVFNPLASEGVDWYGNSRLHNLIGSVEYNSPACVHKVVSLATENPEGLRSPNQFGRIPLHYSLDRLSGKLNLAIIKFLIQAYPEGVTVEDNHGIHAYDLCRYWNHGPKIQKLIANASPDFYFRERSELQLGKTMSRLVLSLGSLKLLMYGHVRSSEAFATDDDDDDDASSVDINEQAAALNSATTDLTGTTMDAVDISGDATLNSTELNAWSTEGSGSAPVLTRSDSNI